MKCEEPRKNKPPTSPYRVTNTPSIMPASDSLYLGKQTVREHIDQALAEIIQPDEWLLAAVRGAVASGEGYGADTRRKGGLFARDYLLATDQRLILWGRGMISRSVNVCHYDDIASVEESQGLLLGGIVLNVRGAKQQVRAMWNADVPVAARLVRDLIVQAKTAKTSSDGVSAPRAIYLLRDGGEQDGPFDSPQVQQKLHAGEIFLHTLAWQEGLTEWVPLSQIIRSPALPPPHPTNQSMSATSTRIAPAEVAVSGSSGSFAVTLSPPLEPRAPWFKRRGWQIAFFIFFPYLQVPMMWFWQLYTRPTRIKVTVAGCVWFLIVLALPSPTETLKKEFAENRTALLAQVQAAEQAHDYQRVIALADRYSLVHDPELENYLYTARNALGDAEKKEKAAKAQANTVAEARSQPNPARSQVYQSSWRVGRAFGEQKRAAGEHPIPVYVQAEAIEMGGKLFPLSPQDQMDYADGYLTGFQSVFPETVAAATPVEQNPELSAYKGVLAEVAAAPVRLPRFRRHGGAWRLVG